MFELRTRAVLAIACGIGAAAGVLTYLVTYSVPQALLALGAAASGSVHLIGQLAASDREISSGRQVDTQDNDQNDSRSAG
jgi:hypothetical protein